MTKTWAAVCAAVLALVMIGCTTSPVGQQCVLVKKDPADTDPTDGTRSIAIKESEIAAQQQKDFISFGSTECEDLVCVRSANHGPTDPDPNADAVGECSTSCSPNSQGGCVTGTGVDSTDDAFTCRALVLDSEVLAAFRQSEPALYEQYFGTTQSPYYCARPLPVSGI